MNVCVINRQRGQAASEFVVAMAVMLPLLLGVIYLGKYSDIKHQAIQASRYAAFERALDPHAGVDPHAETEQTIQDETVARFFRDAGQHTIGFEDKATGATRGDENPLWNQLNGDPMIAKYDDVKVALSSQTIANAQTTPLAAMNATATSFKGLVQDRNPLNVNTGVSAVEADVSVDVAKIANFAPLNKIVSIGATTVIATDSWNAGGAQDVANHFPSDPLPPPAVPMRLVGAILNLPVVGPILNTLAKFFVDTGLPVFGCIKPDVVPVSVAPGAQYDPTQTTGDNQCY